MKQLKYYMEKMRPKKAEKTAKETFGGGIGENLPEIFISKNEINKGINIVDILSINNIVSSKSEARRAIKGNGIRLNDKLISDEKMKLELNEFKGKETIKISYGKKKHYKIKIN